MGTLLAATAASVVLAGTGVDPAVKTLLRTTAEHDYWHESEFFRALVTLSTRHGPPAADLTRYDAGGASGGLDNGRAVVVRGPGGPRVVVVLGSTPFSVPGTALQQLVALDPSGRVTDRVTCHINSRYGGLKTEFFGKPEADGADLVVRFVPNPISGGSGHYWHTISRDRQSYTFRAQEKGEPVDWAQQGLLRAALRDGELRVVSPARPPEPDANRP